MKAVHEVPDLQRIAARRLPRMIRSFVDGGADAEITLRANEAEFAGVTFRPRSLVDVSGVDRSVELFGRTFAHPVLLAPAGLAKLVHPEGELAAARAAAAADSVMVLSTASSYAMEEVATAGGGPRWFQLYLWKTRDIIAGLVERAAASRYEALVLTADVPTVGKRVRDLRNGLTLPPKIRLSAAVDAVRHPRWLARFARDRDITFANLRGIADGDDAAALGSYVNQNLINPAAGWDDLRWLRDMWDGPLLVKGVLTAGDARRAVDAGADGLIVSNHGGRQLDGAPAAIRALPGVVAAVGEDTTVLLDGGIRRGSDVVKAVALGAAAVLVGRPWLWGLAAGGEAGVARMLEILADEIDRTLTLIGVPRLGEIDASCIDLPASW